MSIERKPANIFFLLEENICPSLNMMTIGHLKEMDDIPLLSEMFLICISRRRVILGPFVVTNEQYRSAKGIDFARRAQGSETETQKCHWLFDFKKHPKLGDNELGLSWQTASLIAQIPSDWWRNIRQNRLDDHQFGALCRALIKANQMEVAPVGAITYSELSRINDEDDTALFYDLVEDGARYGPDDEPLNEQAIIDMMFGGERSAYEANWPDD